MGLVFLLVNITSVVTVTNIIGFNLPTSFLMVGINTILFHCITKHKLPTFLGTSGLFIGAILTISSKYSIEYAVGGVFMAGICYLIMALAFLKWQDVILNLVPEWLLATAIALIGLGLIPIGSNLIKDNLLIGLISLITMFIIEMKFKGKMRLFSMPISILIASIVFFVINGIPSVVTQNIQFVTPRFNLESFFTISIITFATLFEILADCKNSGDISGVDTFNEVGVFRVLLGNSIGTILSGIVGSSPATSFSENNSAVQLTGYKNTYAQVFAGIFFIILAFTTPITNVLLMIPKEAFAGCLIYLFASVVVNAIKQIANSGINLETDKKEFMIISVMIALFFMEFVICGIAISSIAVAVIVGILLNKLIKRKVKF